MHPITSFALDNANRVDQRQMRSITRQFALDYGGEKSVGMGLGRESAKKAITAVAEKRVHGNILSQVTVQSCPAAGDAKCCTAG